MSETMKIDWGLIKQDYIDLQGNITLKDFAKKHNVKYSTLRSRKNREKWDEEISKVATVDATKKKNVATVNDKKIKKVINNLEDANLTEKQRLFCLYYIKSFNATMAAIKAGYSKESAHVIGHENLRKPNIKAEIQRLKGTMTQDIFIDAMDVLRKYIEIAFADVTDYVKFGQKEVQVMGAFGPVVDEDGEPVTRIVNYIDLKESDEIDGTILSEVSQGKDGVKVKLLDKMKALEKLELYFDLFPDKFKRKIEEEKLKISREKLEIEKTKFQGEDEEYEDDGFIEALKGHISEVWEDEDTEED